MKQFNKILKAITIVILFAFSAQTITAQDGDWEWLLAAGRGGNDWANDMVRDQQENLYITGAFTHTAIFGKDVNGNTITLTSLPNSLERFVAKYNKAGQCLWVKSICNIKANNSNRKGSIAIDNLGNLFVGGTSYGDIVNGSDTLLHYQRGVYSFVSSFSQQDGNLKWIRIAGSGAARNDTLANEAYCTSLAPDNQGGVYSAGYFIEEMYIDSTANQKTYVKANTLSYSSFLLKYNDAGNLQWKRLIKGNTGWGAGVASIKTNSKGNVFVTGNVSGNQYIETDGQGGLDSLITDPYSAQYLISDVFILKYSPDGIFKKKTRIGGQNRQSPNDLFIDQYDNMFITGNFQYYADFSGNSITAKGSTDIFILKLDTSFNLQWDKYIQGVGEEIANYIIANDNNVYITGYFNNTIYFTETDYTTNDSLRDIFIAKYNKTDGTFLSALQAGGTKDDEGWGIAVDDCENIYATGYFTSPSYFDNDTLSGSTYREIFLGKYNVHYSDFIPDASLCPNKQITLTATNLAPTQFPLSWSNSQTNTNEIILSPTITTTYTLTVSDANGCTASDRAIVKVLEGSLCYTKLQDAYCNVINISPNKTLYADTMQGAEMYEFWVYNENENYTLKSYDNSLALYKIHTLGSGQTYNVKVRAMKNEAWTEWGDACTINIMEYIKADENSFSYSSEEFDELNGTYYTPPMKVFDRFGNSWLMDDMQCHSFVVTAGIFSLHIEDIDKGNKVGFDDKTIQTYVYNGVNIAEPRGLARLKTLMQVFKDISVLINGRNLAPGAIQVRIRDTKEFMTNEYANAAGVGSAMYSMKPNQLNRGFVEQYLITGENPYVGLANGNVSVENSYHGQVGFNFQTFNLTTLGEANVDNDLYMVSLHEIMHMLGFASLINEDMLNGTNDEQVFSFFDKFLKYNDINEPLVKNSNTNPTFNSKTINPCTSNNVVFNNNGCINNKKVFTSLGETFSYKNGSTFSHFNCESCIDAEYNMDYIMNFTYCNHNTRRFLHPDEIEVLKDLGYSISNPSYYGDNSTNSQSIVFNGITYNIASAWAGEDKTINSHVNGNFDNLKIGLCEYGSECYSSNNLIGISEKKENINPNENITIKVNDLLLNDFFNNQNITNSIPNFTKFGITNVQILNINNTSTVSISTEDILTTGSEFIFNSGYFVGNIILSYKPVLVNAQNQIIEAGNMTDVFISINKQIQPECNVNLNSCNLLCNSSFEDFPAFKNFNVAFADNPNTVNNIGVRLAYTFEQGSPLYLWNNANSPDRFYFENNIMIPALSGAGKSIVESMFHSSIPLPQHGNQYIGIFTENSDNECIFMNTKQNLTPGKYRLEFYYYKLGLNNSLPLRVLFTNGLSLNLNAPPIFDAVNSPLIVFGAGFETSIALYGDQSTEWIRYEMEIEIPLGQTADHLMITAQPLFAGEHNYVLFDNFNLTKVGEPKVNSVVSNTNPCIGDEINIQYTFERVLDPQTDIDIKVRFNNLEKISGDDFDVNGETTINAADWINNIATKNIKLKIPEGYILGNSTLVSLDILTKDVCNNNGIAENVVIDNIEPGLDLANNLTITHSGKYNTDKTITYIVKLDNESDFPITGLNGEISIDNSLNIVEYNNIFTINGMLLSFTNQLIMAHGTEIYTFKLGFNSPPAYCTDKEVLNKVTITNADNICNSPLPSIQNLNVPINNFSVTPNTSICKGNSITITATGGVSYSWNSPSGGLNQSFTITPTTNKTYRVTIKDENGCTASLTTIITLNPIPIADAGSDQTISLGASKILTASGGTSYYWNTGETSVSISVNPTKTTIYMVTVRDVNGCSATDQVVVTVNAVTADAGPDQTICTGKSATLTATGGDTYSWSTGAIESEITIESLIETTTYTVTAIKDGVTVTDQVIVFVNQLPNITASASDNIICSGSSTTLTATGGTSYSWSTNATTNIITPTSMVTSTYTVTGTDANGCTNTASVIITVNTTTPIANAGNDQTICILNHVTLATEECNNCTYSWSNGLTAASITVSPSFTKTYTLTTTLNGCTSTDEVVVTVDKIMIPGLLIGEDPPPPPSICFGEKTTITAPITNPENNTTYIWNTGANTKDITVFPEENTTYFVTITKGACVAEVNIEVIVFPLPEPNLGADKTICEGQSVDLTAETCVGCTYSWSNGATTGANINVTPIVTTTYTVTVSNNACSASDEIVVNVDKKITIIFLSLDGLQTCSGSPIALNVPKFDSYLWGNGATTSSITVSPIETTTYSLTVTRGACVATAERIVTVFPLPEPNLGTDITICQGEIATLTATGGDTYSWSNGATSSSITVTPEESITYTVIVNKLYPEGIPLNCSATDDVIVTVVPIPSANAGPDQTICQGETATLAVTGGDTYSWSNGATTASINVNPIATTYTVTVSNNGCSTSATDQVIVSIAQEDFTIYNNSNLVINNQALIYVGSFPEEMENKKIAFNTGYGMIIENGAMITLTNCTLTSTLCGNDQMWEGIEVRGSGRLILNNCLIENAKIAVKAGVYGNIYATETTFRNNYKNLFITEGVTQKKLPGDPEAAELYIDGCTFLTDENLLIKPYQNQISTSGIEIEDVRVNEVNNIIISGNNTFINLEKGIFSKYGAPTIINAISYSGGGIEVRNSTFNNVGKMKWNYGIYPYQDNLFGYGAVNSIGGNVVVSNCSITNCSYGIMANNCDELTITNNPEISTTNSAIYAYGVRNATITDNTNITHNNKIKSNSVYYIFYKYTDNAIVLDHALIPNANTTITVCTLNLTGVVSTGISISNNKANINVSGNTIKMVKPDPFTIGWDDDLVTMTGIKINNCNKPISSNDYLPNVSFYPIHISNNTIENNQERIGNGNFTGISINTSTRGYYSNNVVKNTYNSFFTSGDCKRNQFINNAMTNSFKGINFQNSTMLSDQQPENTVSGVPTCNRWEDLSGIIDRSASNCHRVGGEITLWQNTNGIDIKPKWFFSGANLNLNNKFSPYVLPDNPIGNQIQFYENSGSCANTKSNKANNNSSQTSTISNDSLAKWREAELGPIVRGTLSFSQYNDEYVYQAKVNAYRMLKANPDLLTIKKADNRPYQTFYNQTQSSNIGKLEMIKDLMVGETNEKSGKNGNGNGNGNGGNGNGNGNGNGGNGNCNGNNGNHYGWYKNKNKIDKIESINNSIVPTNTSEAYQQEINEIFLNTIAEGLVIDSTASEQLMLIALDHSFLYPDAVFMARGLLGIDVDEHEELEIQTKEGKQFPNNSKDNSPFSILNSIFSPTLPPVKSLWSTQVIVFAMQRLSYIIFMEAS